MLESIVEILKSTELFFEEYPFFRDFLLAVAGVVFGGIITVLVNNGARRKQALFEMQLEMLEKEAAAAEKIAKKIENIEIVLSFEKATIEELSTEIEKTQTLILKLNERLREKRVFVLKYLSATTVEESARLALDFMKTLYTMVSEESLDFKLKENLDQSDIEALRKVECDAKRICKELTEDMECVIEPGLFARIRRKFRKPKMLLDEVVAIAKVESKKKS